MADEDIKAAAELAASPRPVEVSRDAPGVLKLMAVAFATLCLFGAGALASVSFLRWPDFVAHDRVMALTWFGALAIGGNLVMVLAFCSPYLGRISVKGGPVDIAIDGTATPKPE